MKKKVTFIMAIIIIACFALCSCGDGSENPSNATAKSTQTISGTTSSAQNTDGGIIAATKAPSATPTQTPDSASQYVDLISDNKYLTFSASSMEAEGTADELGPAYCFDEDEETRWSSIFYDVEGCWICVEFGYPVIINGVSIDENQTWGMMLEWEAQYYSESKQAWVTAYEGYTADPFEYYKFDKNTEETYAFRLYFLAGTGKTITINEIDLDGIFVDVEEGTLPKEPNAPKNEEIVIPDHVKKLSGDWIYAASSIENDDLKADCAFDGDINTRWGSAFGGLFEAWISADFREAVSISGFVVKEATAWGYVNSYSAQIMENGEWKTIYEGEKFSHNEYVALDKPVSAAQFRFLIHDGQTLSETVSIFEIEFYG